MSSVGGGLCGSNEGGFVGVVREIVKLKTWEIANDVQTF